MKTLHHTQRIDFILLELKHPKKNIVKLRVENEIIIKNNIENNIEKQISVDKYFKLKKHGLTVSECWIYIFKKIVQRG